MTPNTADFIVLYLSLSQLLPKVTKNFLSFRFKKIISLAIMVSTHNIAELILVVELILITLYRF